MYIEESRVAAPRLKRLARAAIVLLHDRPVIDHGLFGGCQPQTASRDADRMRRYARAPLDAAW